MINTILGKIYAKTSGSLRLERIWKLAQVDFKKRYYNDKLGVLWTILNPIFQITIFYFVFKYIRDSREENFVLFLYVGIISFNIFTSTARLGLKILKQKMYLLENIQFEKIDIFWAAGLTAFMTSCIDYFIYFVVAFFLGGTFNLYSLLILPFSIFLILQALALAMILAWIKLHLNDIMNIWRIISFALFWVSGVFFSGYILLQEFPSFLYLNPLLGQLINFRKIFLQGLPPDLFILGINFIQMIISLGFGLWIINRNWHLVSERL